MKALTRYPGRAVVTALNTTYRTTIYDHVGIKDFFKLDGTGGIRPGKPTGKRPNGFRHYSRHEVMAIVALMPWVARLREPGSSKAETRVLRRVWYATVRQVFQKLDLSVRRGDSPGGCWLLIPVHGTLPVHPPDAAHWTEDAPSDFGAGATLIDLKWIYEVCSITLGVIDRIMREEKRDRIPYTQHFAPEVAEEVSALREARGRDE